jgi:hypothetical protein
MDIPLDMSLSTNTILANLDFTIDLERLYRMISIDVNFKQELLPRNYKKTVEQINCPCIYYVWYDGEWKGYKKKKRILKKKRISFKKQITININIERKINLMIFEKCIKACGCQYSNDMIHSIEYINRKYLRLDNFKYTLLDVMVNITIKLPYELNKVEVNRLFNSIDKCLAIYEPTSQSHVNIRMENEVDKRVLLLAEINNGEIMINRIYIDETSDKKTSFMVFEKCIIISSCSRKQLDLHVKFFLEKLKLFKNKLLLNKNV